MRDITNNSILIPCIYICNWMYFWRFKVSKHPFGYYTLSTWIKCASQGKCTPHV